MQAVWDERLMTRARAADMAGMWELYLDHEQPDITFLRCSTCKGNVTLLPADGKIISVDGMIAAVLGHMVKCHGCSLSGRPE